MLTYLDSNVLVNAATGANRAIQLRALAIITDPNRQFVSSLFLRMEVIPLAIHFGRTKERLFYEAFFRRVQSWVDPVDIYDDAYQLACQHALGALDALHVAAASFAGAELVSAEKPTKPLYRAYHKAVSIF
ncbi:MAG: PIN domain-containing protein [Acidobacteria bacterium]|nr:PIN domain-containing protein [Acidobacteriota bacterium]MBI3423118.1 PIN domain-containing protein [Acidobacteriota bacterium]